MGTCHYVQKNEMVVSAVMPNGLLCRKKEEASGNLFFDYGYTKEAIDGFNSETWITWDISRP